MATNDTTQPQFFTISNMHNLSWSSTIPMASFSLTVLVGNGTQGGPLIRDNILKCHQGNYWIEGKSIKAKKPWTDRSGKVHEWDTINSFHTMDKALLQQLTDLVKSLYREDGNYEALNNASTTATPVVQAVQTAETTTTTASIANGTTVQPVAQAQEVAVAK